MQCRSDGRDCYDVHGHSLDFYLTAPNAIRTVQSASALVDDGRAGTLDRVQEVIAFILHQNFRRIGVAACWSMKDTAREFCEELEQHGVIALPVWCTSGAVREREIDSHKDSDSVSCNPAGQAETMNRLQPDLVVEMGLCLGHDILFHQHLEVPHTVLAVKDRRHHHAPLSHFSSFRGPAERFFDHLDLAAVMKTPEWLAGQLETDTPPAILDLRGEAAFERARIPGSRRIESTGLPRGLEGLHPDRPVIFVCNGGIHSAFAVMYLSMRGFPQVFNLSGGFSRWEKEGYSVDRTPSG